MSAVKNRVKWLLSSL